MYYAIMSDNVNEIYKFFNTAKTDVILPEKKKNETVKTENKNEYTIKDLLKATGAPKSTIYRYLKNNPSTTEHIVRKNKNERYFDSTVKDLVMKHFCPVFDGLKAETKKHLRADIHTKKSNKIEAMTAKEIVKDMLNVYGLSETVKCMIPVAKTYGRSTNINTIKNNLYHVVNGTNIPDKLSTEMYEETYRRYLLPLESMNA